MFILSGGALRIKSMKALLLSSLHISANAIYVETDGAISGDGVVLVRSSSWSGTSISDISSAFTSYGRASNGRTGGAGGGHAGSGTAGFENNFPGVFRGYAGLPRGSGGPGGSGPRGAGGNGGAGLMLTVYNSFELNGTLSVNGDSAWGTGGGGGGAGGSLDLTVMGQFTGHGHIAADGGHGSVTSSIFGGGGAAGRIKVSACLSEFHGSFSALGGLSLQSIPSYNLSAGAAGTVFLSNKECSVEANSYSNLAVMSWEASSIYNDGSLSYLKNLVAETENSTISINTATTVFDILGDTYSDEYRNESTFDLIEVYNSEASLQFVGRGTVVVSNQLAGDSKAAYYFSESVRYHPLLALDIRNISLYIYGTIVQNVCDDLTVSSGAKLYFGMHASSLRGDSSSSGVICFNDVVIDDARVEGPSINITASTLSLQGSSAITSDGLGHSGGVAGGFSERVSVAAMEVILEEAVVAMEAMVFLELTLITDSKRPMNFWEVAESR